MRTDRCRRHHIVRQVTCRFQTPFVLFLPCDAVHERVLCRHAVSVCLSFRQGCRGYGDSHGYGYGMGMGIKIQSPRQPCILSIMFVYSVETSKHIFKSFSLSDSHTVLVFLKYSNGTTPSLMGASNASGVGKNRDSHSRPISGFGIDV